MIELAGVTKVFSNENGSLLARAVEDLRVTIAKEEFVCVLGPSGCGKSTLINLIAGFEAPTAGQVRCAGRPVTGPGTDRGVVFQEPTLFPWLTAQQNVEFPLRNLGVPRPERRARAAECLRLVGLEGSAQVRPHQLSGGMKQRVALARVLAMEPLVLLMDEPFGALDAETRERLQDELLRIWTHSTHTVLFVTHNVEEAAYLADRVIVMGRPPRSVLADFPVSLPRPRSRRSAELSELAGWLRGVLSREVIDA